MNEKNIPQFLVAAPHSGSGKTTLSRGLMAALVRRGLAVQPFKCGPDYIDTKFHETVCHRPSYNLDTFMASPCHVKQLYHQQCAAAEVGVVEGMMGLFDGYERNRGSSAEIASLLGLPVVLVVDARSAAYSVAPLLLGFKNFQSDVHVAGVIFNKTGSLRHQRMLREACAAAGMECLGCLPREEELEQASRYLGLDFSSASHADVLAHRVEENIDIDRLLQLTARPVDAVAAPKEKGDLSIAVLRNDEAFSFLYAEHLSHLSQMGHVTFLDPEKDAQLPSHTDLLYLPGGYPEKHATALSGNRTFMQSIFEYIENGGRALAECGGMIYLSQGIQLDAEPDFMPMCGTLPFAISARKADRHLSLGYRQMECGGQRLRGHEFHYTQFAPGSAIPPSTLRVTDARGELVETPIFRYKNLWASYTHLYWGETDITQLF